MAGFLLANLAIVGTTLALFSASGSVTPLRSQVLFGGTLSVLVLGVLFGLQVRCATARQYVHGCFVAC